MKELDIPACMLPEAKPSSGIFGHADAKFLGGEIPIAGVAGDQQSALFGQTCFEAGEAKNTYGTGCFLLMNTGERPVFSNNGLVTTVAWGRNGKVNYALEGSIFVAGAAIQWLRDEMKLIESAADSEYMAQKVRDTNGCYVVPAFTGLGAPHWDQYARGTIVGLSRGCNKYHIIRATLDSICYQVNDVLAAMQADSGIPLNTLRVDGGASANNYLMQTQADIINAPVARPRCVETTAMGAAFLAGLAVKYWADTEEIKHSRETEREFYPSISEAERSARTAGWNRAVSVPTAGQGRMNDKMIKQYDVVIIGAGVTGCAAARYLSRYKVHAAVIERAEDVCAAGASKANSAIVHAGFDAPTGSLMAKLNVEGSRVMPRLAKELDFSYMNNGSLVVCMDEADYGKLERLYQNGLKNGVEGLEIVRGERLREIEPAVRREAYAALWAPTGAIICPFGLTIALAENAAANGVEFIFNTAVTALRHEQGAWSVQTDKELIRADAVINAAGTYADVLHNMVSTKRYT